MKKYISYFASCGLRFSFVALMTLFSANQIFAQNKQTENKWEENFVVAYESAFSYSLNSDVSWELKESKGKTINQGTGDIVNQIFKKPGNYTLFIKENHSHNPNSCDHAHFPTQVNIVVSPVKMVFDKTSVKFSENIIGGKSTKGITMSVNVVLSSYDNSITVYQQDFATSGVGTSITGKLKNGEAILKQGINTLEFLLDGQAEKGNYIMIDFIDINGKVQPYGLTQKIQ